MNSSKKFSFEPAQRKQMRARIAVSGISGAGKTYTALELATGLAGESGQIAVIDSQGGQSCLYADLYDFRVLQIDTHSPELYAEIIQSAGEQGFSVIIVDTISQAWNGSGGALELVDKAAKQFSGNSYSGWSKVTPLQNKLMEAIQNSPAHVIATLRAKQEYALEKDTNGKAVPVKVGMGVVQRDGFEYSLDIEISMDENHFGTVTKTRYHDIEQMVIEKPDRDLAHYILERLNVGSERGEEHWSDSFKKRSYLLSLLDKEEVPHDALFACYGANSWDDMKMVSLPEGGSKAIIQTVAEWYADNG